MDKQQLHRIFLFCAVAMGILLFAISRIVQSAGFLILILALLCFFAAFAATLYLPFKRPFAKKAARAGKILTLAALVLGILSFITVEALIVAGWPDGEPQPADCLIVLGAGLRGEQLSAVLHSRVSLAAEYLQQYPDCIAVVSGGQGPGESITEALAMKRYLEGQGVDPRRIIMEDKSRNTEQNLQFSLDILSELGLDSGKIAVLSNSFHLFRAKKLAAQIGYDVLTIGAPIPKIGLVPLNSYVREYFSIVFMLARALI